MEYIELTNGEKMTIETFDTVLEYLYQKHCYNEKYGEAITRDFFSRFPCVNLDDELMAVALTTKEHMDMGQNFYKLTEDEFCDLYDRLRLYWTRNRKNIQ
jgi:hypothetical protein